MKYKEIIDYYAKETPLERLKRLEIMYSADDDLEEKAADIDLAFAQTAKLRTDALVALSKLEAEYEEHAAEAEREIALMLIETFVPRRWIKHPDD